MRAESRQSGVTLAELTVVMAAVVVLAALSLPAVRAVMRSFESGSSTRAMISAALASARAIAAKEQSYVGVRFQKAYNPDEPDPLKAPQYMIFIMHDPNIPPSVAMNLGCGAVKGVKPMKLPDSVGVMDLVIGSAGNDPIYEIGADEDIDEAWEVVDTSTFTILFSPAGKLVPHTHKAQSQDATDDVFNTIDSITSLGVGMFVEDQDEPAQPIDELSRNHFVIYDRREFEQAYKRGEGEGYSGYLMRLSPIYVNPYMGTLISTE
jgi:hypothetical protein